MTVTHGIRIMGDVAALLSRMGDTVQGLIAVNGNKSEVHAWPIATYKLMKLTGPPVTYAPSCVATFQSRCGLALLRVN